MKIYFRIFRVVLLFNYQGSRSLSDLFYTDISLSVLLTCCLRQRYISYHFCFSLSRTFLFYFFEVFQKNKILEIFLISCFRTSKKPHAFTLCFLSLSATAICILQHFTVVVNTFFHFLSLTFQPYKKLLYIVDSTTAERVGFEPTRPCGQTVFKTASL